MTERLVVDRFEIRIVLGHFTEIVFEIGGPDLGRHQFAIGVDDAQGAVVELQPPRAIGEAGEQGGEVGEGRRFFREVAKQGAESLDRALQGGEGIGQQRQHLIALLLGQRCAHAAGHGPGRMNPLARQDLDDLLADLPQADAVARHLRHGCGDAHQIARFRRRVHTEQQVGGGEMKDAQRVRLQDLRHVQNAAQTLAVGRDAHCQNRVTGFTGGDQVAYRTDTANTRHQRRHFVVRAPFAELFEPAILRHVESGGLHRAVSA